MKQVANLLDPNKTEDEYLTELATFDTGTFLNITYLLDQLPFILKPIGSAGQSDLSRI